MVRRFVFQFGFQLGCIYDQERQPMLTRVETVGNVQHLMEAREMDKALARQALGAVFAASPKGRWGSVTGSQHGVSWSDVKDQGHCKTW